jgi:ABC-type branched-subunit amino acid transport system permease subunit
VILGVLAQLLPAQEVQGLFYGGALIVILLVARNGLLGLVRREGTL